MFYQLHNGKNPKWIYYSKNIFQLLIPNIIYRIRLNPTMSQKISSTEKTEIEQRVSYYNKLEKESITIDKLKYLSDLKFKKKGSVYFFDTYEFTKWFNPKLRFNYCFGDVTYIPDIPSIVKSRPINGDNKNSILLNLDKVRHFVFVDDKMAFQNKSNQVIFRGKVQGKEGRIKFLKMYFNHPMCDLGEISRNKENPNGWITNKKTLNEHLKYKFILALEGNDVASNLKWVMSSNSIAVMPKPTYETWFMEGTLIPNVHYIEIKPDYSDLEERLTYYIEHENEALMIIDEAHRYVSKFRNKKREKLISLLVLQKYFIETGQVN